MLLLTDTLSLGNFGQGTVFIFSGTVLGPSSGIITPNHGIALFVGGNLITALGAEDPTTAQNTSYTITAAMVGQPFRLFYVAANNLPEVLPSPNLGRPSLEPYGCLARVSAASHADAPSPSGNGCRLSSINTQLINKGEHVLPLSF